MIPMLTGILRTVLREKCPESSPSVGIGRPALPDQGESVAGGQHEGLQPGVETELVKHKEQLAIIPDPR